MNKLILVIFSWVLLAGCSTPSENSQSYKSAKVHTELAGLYYQRGQYGVALDELKKALSADSDFAQAYNVRALVHMALRENKDADVDFQRSLSLDNTNSDAHNNYGWFLCQNGRSKEAIPQFMDAIKNPLYTTPGRAYLNAGLCSRKAGDNKDAEYFLQKSLLAQPQSGQTLFALADLNYANGHYFAAKKYFSDLAQKAENLSAEQLWLGIRINRKIGNRSAADSYATQLRNRFPDASETQMLINAE